MARLLWLLLFLPLLSACDQTNEAEQLAGQFWQAIEQQQFEQAAALTIESDAAFIQTTLFLYRDHRINLGDAKRIQNRVIIPTSLIPADDSKPVHLYTIVTLNDGQWQIDYQRMVKAFLGGLKEQIRDKLQDSSDWLEQKIDQLQDLIEPWLEDDQPYQPDQQTT